MKECVIILLERFAVYIGSIVLFYFKKVVKIVIRMSIKKTDLNNNMLNNTLHTPLFLSTKMIIKTRIFDRRFSLFTSILPA